MKTAEELINIVLDSFEAEKNNEVVAGEKLIAEGFKRIDMLVSGDKIFPTLSGEDIPIELRRAYKVKGREFHIWNLAANEKSQTVFVELAEAESGRIWPYVLVCQIKDGKIWRSRHYGDPGLLKKNVSFDQIKKAVKE